jgi:hypothetical protein
MTKDFITERLKFLTEFFKLAWLSILGVGGGSVSLLLGPFDLRRYAWAGAGLILTLGLLVLLWHNHRKMKKLWADLEKIGEKS